MSLRMRGSSPKICCVADEHFVPLWVERYVAALPPSHPLTLKERLRTADLAGVAMIDRCHCEQSEFFGRAASAPRQPAAIAESEDWAMALVAAGVGDCHRSRRRGARPFRCRRARDRRRREARGRARLQRGATAVGDVAELYRKAAAATAQSGPRSNRRARPGARVCTLKRRETSLSPSMPLAYCRATLSSRNVARFLHTRKSVMTLMAAARTSAQSAAFETVSIVPSISMAWTALPATMTIASSVWAMRHVRGRSLAGGVRPTARRRRSPTWRSHQRGRTASAM